MMTLDEEEVRRADIVFCDGRLVWGEALGRRMIRTNTTACLRIVRLSGDVNDIRREVHRIKRQPRDGNNRLGGC
jgi:hypothetical protein